MKKTVVWIVALVLVGLAGCAVGKASSGIKHVTGREFIAYADPQPAINSAFSATLIGATHQRAYLEYWSGVPHFGPDHTVIWTSLSELPADVAQQLREGKNPWVRK